MSDATSHTARIRDLIERAQQADQAALGELLEVHRPYLRMLARRYIGRQLRARVDESDLIQQTCLSAFRNFPQYAGPEADQFLIWLKQIHERNIQDCLRQHLNAAKRSLHKEEPVSEPQLADLAGDSASPSQRLLNREDAVRLAQLLETLPDDQQEAIRLRHLENWPLKEIAQHLQRSDQAVCGLLKRGMRKLREQLQSGRGTG